jgi:ethanolamine ammonia-lyase large subunit
MKRPALVLLLLVCCVPIASAQSNCKLTFLTESVPDFTRGQAVHFMFEGVSGTEPYTFAVTSGTLPTGLQLNTHGKLTGTPTMVIDTTVMIKLTDAANCSINQTFALRVVAPKRHPVVVHKSSH